MAKVHCEDQASLSEDYFVESNDNYEEYDPGEIEDPSSNRKKRDISSMIKTEKFTDEEEGDEAIFDSPDEKEDEETNGGNKNCRKITGSKVDDSDRNTTESTEEDLFGQIVAKKLKKITNPKKRADAEFKIFSILHSALVEEFDS